MESKSTKRPSPADFLPKGIRIKQRGRMSELTETVDGLDQFRPRNTFDLVLCDGVWILSRLGVLRIDADDAFPLPDALLNFPLDPTTLRRVVGQKNNGYRALRDSVRDLLPDISRSFTINRFGNRPVIELQGNIVVLCLSSQQINGSDILVRKADKDISLASLLPITQFLLGLQPLDVETWVRICLVALSVVVVVELHKLVRRPAAIGRQRVRLAG